MMDAPVKTIQLPADLYQELESLASEEESDPVTLLTRLVKEARQRRSLRQLWDELCDVVQSEGGLDVDATTEEIVEKLRKTRQEIFDAEYAHLYR
jgi:hypothetical protein